MNRKFHILKLFKSILLLLVVLIACQVPIDTEHTLTPLPAQQTPQESSGLDATVLPTAHHSLPPTETTTQTPTNTPEPTQISASTSTPELAGITLYYHDYAQVELISPQGMRVMIDVHDPTLLSHPPTAEDILLTTHHHYDHYNESFVESFPGQQLDQRAGRIDASDVIITGIPSAHNAGDRMKAEGGTNYIFLIEMGGLRIAHFGDIGQESLTPDQLVALNPVDIAITQFRNPYSDMGMDNLKGFRLMDQVQPRLVIPTHASRETIQHGLTLWAGYIASANPVHIDRERLRGDSKLLLMGTNASANSGSFTLLEW